MPLSDEFMAYVLDQLGDWGGVTARKMFGGAGLYRDGRMFGLIADDVVYLKVDDTNRPAFIEAGSGPFKPYPDKPTEMSYYELPPDILESPPEFVEWSQRSLAIQQRKK
jgi:DNA transformation protein